MENEVQNQNEKENNKAWGTWEELLLACAVKRHGLEKWDTVAMEVETKTSLPKILTTVENCQRKYHDLNHRFSKRESFKDTQQEIGRVISEYDEDKQTNNNNSNDSQSGTAVDKVVNIPWIEELRKLRVAELKQEVQRYDVSIHALQRKVKRLEEERAKSFQDKEQEHQTQPDLKHDTSQSHFQLKQQQQPDNSVNESNSTASQHKDDDDVKKLQIDPIRFGSKPEAVVVIEESSSSLTQLNAELQSSTSLGRWRRRKDMTNRTEVPVAVAEDGINNKKKRKSSNVLVQAGPLFGLLDIIRGHKHSSFFEARLQIQETAAYKNMVRQHLDLELIQTRLEQGYYSPSTLSFYRDLLLLFNNAIVFFPNPSVESHTAYELRSLVSNQIKQETQKSCLTQSPQSNSELESSDSLLAKHKSTAPLIACRTRSSVSAKPSPYSLEQKIEQQQGNDNKPASGLKPPVVGQSLPKIKSKEKAVTGTRSSKRSNKNLITGNTTPIKKQNASPGTKVVAADKPQKPKIVKKKTEALALALDKKRSAGDFLKRMKRSSPVGTSKKNSRGGSSSHGEQRKDRNGKLEKVKSRALSKNTNKKQVKVEGRPSGRSIGRPSKEVKHTNKKHVKVEGRPSGRSSGRPSKKEMESTTVFRKRSGEDSGKELDKRPRKRSRR